MGAKIDKLDDIKLKASVQKADKQQRDSIE